MPTYRPFQLVRVTKLRASPEQYDGWKLNQRAPRLGDVGTVVEVSGGTEERFVVECAGPTGVPEWRGELSAEELQPVGTTPTTPEEALSLLEQLGAPARLVRHHELVVEAAELLVRSLVREFALRVDAQRVLVGAALHDVGKLQHPDELRIPGSAHERAGEALLLARGVSPAVARFCWTHAAWTSPEVDLEDLLVATADKLWRGKRETGLEQRLVAAIAAATGVPAWETFSRADEIFGQVAAAGDERLERSRS